VFPSETCKFFSLLAYSTRILFVRSNLANLSEIFVEGQVILVQTCSKDIYILWDVFKLDCSSSYQFLIQNSTLEGKKSSYFHQSRAWKLDKKKRPKSDGCTAFGSVVDHVDRFQRYRCRFVLTDKRYLDVYGIFSMVFSPPPNLSRNVKKFKPNMQVFLVSGDFEILFVLGIHFVRKGISQKIK